MARFPYTIPSPGVFKPWIPVRLGHKKTHRVLPAAAAALIDSGADVCFCATYIGDWLGVDLKKKQTIEFTAANNEHFQTKCAVVTLYACGKQFDCPFYFSDTLPQNTPIILGQKGFFDRFRIVFDLPHREIEIT